MRKLLMLLLSLLALNFQLLAQNRMITGRVIDERGNPVANASVTVRGTSIGTVSDAEGRYSLSIPASATVLVFSSVEAGTSEVTIGNQSTINPTLKANNNTLGEVVITGYTTRRRTEFTGATSKVTSKAIDQVPLASFEQILQGRAPGLYIASGSGQPGTAARVNIRGVGSISGSSTPLYVLDGVRIEPQVFRTLNPNDFESVDVLRDAAGAGQYGSAGANGVIVITTKRGRPGKTNFTVRGQTGFSTPPTQNNIRLMNTEERLQFEERILGGPAGVLGTTGLTGFPGWDYSPNNPRYATLTAAQRATNAALLDSIRAINTDWPSLFFQNGKFNQYEINASGGSQGLTFFTSLSYFKQEGIVIGSDLDRYTFRGNLDFKQDRLSVSIRTGAGFSSQRSIESEAGIALANPIAAAYLELPYRRLFLPNGAVDTAAGKTGPNAYDRIFTTDNRSNQFKGNLIVQAQFDLFGGLSIRTINGIDYRNNNQSRYIDPSSFLGGQQQGPSGSRGRGAYGEGNFENLQLQTTTGLVFARNFGGGKHQVNAQAMVEAIRQRSRAFSVTGYGINPALVNTPASITGGTSTNGFIPTFGGAFLPGNSKTVTGLFSQFLLADYTFDQRFTVSGSLRNDAPSQVPEKNRNNVFWSAGFSWNIIREKFMANQNVLDELRLRASYGETANVAGFNSDFGYISTYGPLAEGYAGQPGIIPTSPGNLDYRLESQVITNIGLEAGAFNRRLRASVDFYIKDSRNLFVNQNLSRVTGFRSLATNAGMMRNQGIEFSLSGDPIATTDFLLSFGINGAFNKNTIRSLGGLTEIIQGTGIIRVGYSFGTHFAVGFLGVDPQSGLPVYQDINGNPTTIFNAANSRAEFGTYLPSFTGGANMDMRWKAFDLSVLFTTAQGVQRYNNEAFFYETTNSNATFNKRVELLTQTWTTPGQMTSYQRINSPRQFTSRDIQDASFVRFRNLQVGYTFTNTSQRFVRSVRLWGQGQNLFTWTKWQGFDPEESNNIATYEFPNPRTFTLGLDINF